MSQENLFIPADFPHINLQDAVFSQATGRLHPLCDLKFFGNCQGISLIPLGDDAFFWEKSPIISACALCSVYLHQNP